MGAFSPEEHKLVSDAVSAAERASDGEIVTIVAQRSDAYHDVGLHYAVLAMLLVPTIWAALPQDGSIGELRCSSTGTRRRAPGCF